MAMLRAPHGCIKCEEGVSLRYYCAPLPALFTSDAVNFNYRSPNKGSYTLATRRLISRDDGEPNWDGKFKRRRHLRPRRP